jgi:hypothetical protein
LLKCINKHGLLSIFQFGFRKKSSAAAADTEIVDEILGAIDGKKIGDKNGERSQMPWIIYGQATEFQAAY